MGDRGNIRVASGDGFVYLYSHWGGSELPVTLKEALAREQRWNEESYLARIIFDTMTFGEQGSETGYGIATYAPDSEHPVLTVDCDKQAVITEDGEDIPFKDYILMDDNELRGRFT